MPSRALGAFSPTGELVGIARDFDADLSVPGGADVPAAGVTAVGVLSHHRRQGHLTRLMDDPAPVHGRSRHRGRPPRRRRVADLRALRVRPGHRRVRVRHRHSHARASATEPSGAIEVVMPGDLRPELERVHELRRRRTPGAISRAPRGLGALCRRAIVARASRTTRARSAARCGAIAAGEVQGAVAYKVDRQLGAEPPRRQGRGHPARGRDARGRARAVAAPVRDRLDRHRHGRQPRRRRPAAADAGRRPLARSCRPVRLHLGAAARRPCRPGRSSFPARRSGGGRGRRPTGLRVRAVEHRARLPTGPR